MNQASAALQLVAIVAASLFPMPAIAGDEDEASPYMIYIDPQTGKYTTTDPESEGAVAHKAEKKEIQTTEQVQREMSGLSVSIVIAFILFLAGILFFRRRA